MAAQPEDFPIAALTNGGDTPILKIRCIRKWNPPFRKTQTCFIFIDREGTPIQANAKTSEQKPVENKLRLGSCYLMRKYGCGDVDNYANILTHSTHLMIGSTTVFTPIADVEEIPRVYFDIASPEQMESVCDKDNETIDYIAIVEDIRQKFTTEGRIYLFLRLRDCRNKIIYAVLWDEIANSLERYNRPTIEVAPHPRIAVFTNMKVKMFSQGPRLQSSTATYVYLNPTCPQDHALRDLYASGMPPEQSFNQQLYLQNAGPDAIVTIQELLTKASAQLMHKNFVITGEICQIANKEWCYIACPQCGKTVTKVVKRWFCPKDDLIDDPLYSYRLTAIISDGTGSIDATLFNDAVVQLIQLPCENIIESDPTIDMHQLPSIIRDSVGTKAKFYLQAHRNDRNRSTRCTFNRIVTINHKGKQKIQQSNPKAPITPQQQLSTTPHQTHSLAKRQLLLLDNNDSSYKNETAEPVNAAEKKTKVTTELLSINETAINKAETNAVNLDVIAVKKQENPPAVLTQD